MTDASSAQERGGGAELASSERLWKSEGRESPWAAALSLVWATAAHASVLALALALPAPTSPPLPAAAAEVELSMDAEWPGQSPIAAPGPAPGGGSPEPDPAGPREATAENPGERRPAPVAVRDEVIREHGPASVPASVPVEPEPEGPDSAPVELAAAADALIEAAYPEPIRPRPARHLGLARQQRAPATAPVVAASDERAGQSFGYGPGANGGPGGKGAGWGSGRGGGDDSFGGTRGHFVGQVCALRTGVTSLHRVGECPIIAVLRTDSFNVTPRRFERGFPGVDRNEWFLIEYKGSFEVTLEGSYTFRLISDDGSMLFIDEERVISHDGIHSPIARTGVAHLSAGAHQLRLLYFQGPRFDIALQLFVTPPIGGERLFGPRL